MFTHLDDLGGFTLIARSPCSTARAASGCGVADLLIGSVERIGLHVRTGRLDQMLTRPVPLLVQVCADEFSLRRFGRISQAVIVFAWRLLRRRLDAVARAGRGARWWSARA